MSPAARSRYADLDTAEAFTTAAATTDGCCDFCVDPNAVADSAAVPETELLAAVASAFTSAAPGPAEEEDEEEEEEA
jgi:hypothetical protein